MLAYRIFPYLDKAKPGESGHPLYLHRPQGKGRIDNPDQYDLWYLAETPEGAIAEVFGDLPVWSEAMFDFPMLPGARRALGVYEIDDGLNVLDLDDAQVLVDRQLRPTQVVGRQRAVTRSWALKIFQEAHGTGERKWSGVKWWSFQRPHLTVFGLWVPPGEDLPFELLQVRELSTSMPEVAATANSLARPIS